MPGGSPRGRPVGPLCRLLGCAPLLLPLLLVLVLLPLLPLLSLPHVPPIPPASPLHASGTAMGGQQLLQPLHLSGLQ
jgi:hypothetical protein